MKSSLTETKQEMKNTSLIQAVGRLNQLVFTKENIPYIAFSFLITTVTIGLNFASPYILSEALETLYSDENQDIFGVQVTPLEIIAASSASMLISKVGNILKRSAVIPAVINTKNKLLNKFSKKLLDLSHNHHISTPLEAQYQVLNWCDSSAIEYTSGLITQIIPTTMETVAAISILSSWYGAPIGISLTSVIGLYSALNLLSASKFTAIRNDKVTTANAVYNQFTSLIKNYEAIHTFSNDNYELKKFDNILSAFGKSEKKELFLTDKISLMQSLLTGSGFIAMSLYMGYNVEKGKFTVNDFAIVTFYLLQFFGSLSNFGEAINKARGELLNLQRVYDFLEKEIEIKDEFPNRELDVSIKNSKITFKNVSFRYESKSETPLESKSETPLILNHATFEIAAGKKTAIVGTSGGGKSTIAKLLYRFYELKEGDGEIEINNQNIKSVSLSSLRAAISTVPQLPTLFNDTLRTNISYGGLSLNNGVVTDDEINKATEEACLDGYISRLEKGLETNVGEGGKKISGGQLQRVAIARAILKKPIIYIFDEATAALDSKTEQEIQDNMDRVSKGTTTLVITHRLGTISNADHIIVIDEGNIVEEGKHKDLLERKGFYAKLWKTQSHPFSENIAETSEYSYTRNETSTFFSTCPLGVNVNSSVVNEEKENSRKTPEANPISSSLKFGYEPVNSDDNSVNDTFKEQKQTIKERAQQIFSNIRSVNSGYQKFEDEKEDGHISITISEESGSESSTPISETEVKDDTKSKRENDSSLTNSNLSTFKPTADANQDYFCQPHEFKIFIGETCDSLNKEIWPAEHWNSELTTAEKLELVKRYEKSVHPDTTPEDAKTNCVIS